MIHFTPITIEDKALFDSYLFDGSERGCHYTFANLFMWGRQQKAFLHNHLVLFAHFNCRTAYPFPVGTGDKRQVIDAIIGDARERKIPCRFIGLREEDSLLLKTLYPGQFRFHTDRDSQDYVYDIDALAELKGRKYHGKKNHCNRFLENHPDYTTEEITEAHFPLIRDFLKQWYQSRLEESPDSDLIMEQVAFEKALANYQRLGMEGLLLRDGEEPAAVTLGSRMNSDTFDVHFEKARSDIDGAYTVINREFANHIRTKYPEVRFLDREEDMGLEGLRKAKLSYHPHHMILRDWACLSEEGYDY